MQRHTFAGMRRYKNTITKSNFMSVLNWVKVAGINGGLLFKEGKTYSYEQVRTCLRYFYGERKVCEDGVSTLPPDL